MDSSIRTNRGWLKPSAGAKYAGVDLRVFRRWLKNGLRHVQLENGRILTKFDFIDHYLLKFEARSELVEMAEELTQDL